MSDTLLESERIKGRKTLDDMLAYLAQDEENHTPFMDRWFMLCVEHKTMVYPAQPKGAEKGKRLEYGKPKRLVECIESAASVGKPGVWFIKVVGDVK